MRGDGILLNTEVNTGSKETLIGLERLKLDVRYTNII